MSPSINLTGYSSPHPLRRLRGEKRLKVENRKNVYVLGSSAGKSLRKLCFYYLQAPSSHCSRPGLEGPVSSSIRFLTVETPLRLEPLSTVGTLMTGSQQMPVFVPGGNLPFHLSDKNSTELDCKRNKECGVCVHACACVCICVCMYVYVGVCVHACVCIHVCMCVHSCVRVCAYACMCA